MRQDAFSYMQELRDEHGECVRFHFLWKPVTLLIHPNAVQQVLQKNHRNYGKEATFVFEASEVLLGKGLFTSDGDPWQRQRRLIQPAFRHEQIQSFCAPMTQATEEMLARWQQVKGETLLDMQQEMEHLTLTIATRTLFGTDVREEEATTFANTFEALLPDLAAYVRLPFPPANWPWPRNIRLTRRIRQLDQLIYRLLEQRQHDPHHDQRSDFLSQLLGAHDEETGQGMSDRQIRDESITMLLGGYETTASALSWTWYLLSQYPDVVRRLHAELDQVLGGRTPTAHDLPHLRYTEMIIKEAMRLYPPTLAILRTAREEDTIMGFTITKGSMLLMCPYLTQRHPDFWPDPERFEPERFLQGKQNPQFAYFPFSGGPRKCIGESFAMTEAQLILATVAQRYRLCLAPNAHIEPEALVTIRIREALPMILSPRA